MKRAVLAAIASLTVLTGCLDDSGGSPAREVPQYFWLNADAASRSGDYNLECSLELIIEISGEVSRTDGVVEYLATGGGHASRSLITDDGAGVAIFAEVHLESLQVLHIRPARVQIVYLNNPPHAPPSGSRFWDELRFFDGTMSKDGTISGNWVCAPLDIEYGGIVDDFAFAEGEWHTEEIVETAHGVHSPN